MEKIIRVVKAISVMLLIVILFAACSKTAANPETDTGSHAYKLYTADSSYIGTIMISKVQAGDAKVEVSINTSVVNGSSTTYQPTLKSKTLPMAMLNSLNAEGQSETTPLVSTNRGIIVSYDALVRMGDLKFALLDGQNNTIMVANVQ